jgi:hypothetical protein
MIFIFVALARFLLSSSFLQSKRMGGSLISKVLSIIVIICLLFWVGFLLFFFFFFFLRFLLLFNLATSWAITLDLIGNRSTLLRETLLLSSRFLFVVVSPTLFKECALKH